jgi:hypothetical protein
MPLMHSGRKAHGLKLAKFKWEHFHSPLYNL